MERIWLRVYGLSWWSGGIAATEAYQEDWGWELPAKLGNDSYYLCMSGNADELSADKDEGEWRIIVEKRRSVGERLRGAGKIGAEDKMVRMIEELLEEEEGIREVRRGE